MYSVKELNEHACETYKKSEFFGKHTSLCTALLTIVVSGISSIIAFFSFIYQKNILSYWNIPVEYASYGNGSRIFFIVITNILYITIESILLYKMESCFESIVPYIELKKDINRLLKRGGEFFKR